MSAAAEYALELRGVSRSFGPLKANDHVDLRVHAGTVHAIVGENGAGKSTLLRIAYGELRADAGELRLKGHDVPRERHSPLLAIRHGVGMVHQHFMLVKPLTVVENVILGREPRHHGLLDLASAASTLHDLGQRFGLEVDPWARVEDLTVGLQQRVEILKVLWQGCDVLILDEPTAVLTPAEVRQLFAVLRELVQGGMTVVLITHKLDEVCDIADRITVMRRGRVVEELDGRTASPQAIAAAMVGRPVLLTVARPPISSAQPGNVVLCVEGLHVARQSGSDAVAGVTFQVRAGEVVGLAGVEGNGQSELLEAIVGLQACSAGRILLAGNDITSLLVRERYRAGLAHIPEDRQVRGLVLDFTVQENLILGRLDDFSGRLGLDRQRMRAEADLRLAEADLRPADPAALVAGLSGGNQQKLVVARELARPARLLVCARPTRGVDIGAIEHIHRQLLAARERGLGTLLYSAELSELTALSDRLLVLYRGRVVHEMARPQIEAPDAMDRIGAFMTGAAGAAEIMP